MPRSPSPRLRHADGPAWLEERRADAARRYEAMEPPSPSEEVWRYSRIDQLDVDRYGPADEPLGQTAAARSVGVAGGEGSTDLAALSEGLAELVEAVGPRAALVLTRNGRVESIDTEPGGAKLTISGVASGSPYGQEATLKDLLDRADTPHDALTALHDAVLADAVVVDVPAGAAVADPVIVVHWVDADAAVVPVRTVVTVGEAAEATVVEVIAGADVDSLILPVTSLVAHQTANLRYAGVQLAGPRCWVVAHQGSRVEREATLVTAAVALGGAYARLRTDSALVGKGASSQLLAVYFGEKDQMHDFRTLQDHRAEKTTSELLFKGAVADTSHSVYSGLIRVEKGARGTRAFQTNRNLVLSEGAHADSVPNLEIDENDVACSHASAVGPVDDDQRFYLEARGVPTGVADRLIVLGFLVDVLDRSPVPGLRQPLAAALADRVERVETAVPAEAGA